MLNSPTIVQFDAGLSNTYAFRILGEVTEEDMSSMSELMLAAFEANDEVDMLLSFKSDEGSEFGASLSTETVKARFMSLSKVRNYVVAGAPRVARGMIEAFDHVIPVDARTFDSEAEAIAWLRTQPALA